MSDYACVWGALRAPHFRLIFCADCDEHVLEFDEMLRIFEIHCATFLRNLKLWRIRARGWPNNVYYITTCFKRIYTNLPIFTVWGYPVRNSGVRVVSLVNMLNDEAALAAGLDFLLENNTKNAVTHSPWFPWWCLNLDYRQISTRDTPTNTNNVNNSTIYL